MAGALCFFVSSEVKNMIKHVKKLVLGQKNSYFSLPVVKLFVPLQPLSAQERVASM